MISGDGTTDLPAALERALDQAGPDKGALHSLCVSGRLADDGRHSLAVWAWWHWAQPSDDARRPRLAREILVELREVAIDRFDPALAWIERGPVQKAELTWTGPFEPDLLADRWRVSHRALLSRGARISRCTYTVAQPDDEFYCDRPPRFEGSCYVRLWLAWSPKQATFVELGCLPFTARGPLLARFESVVAALGLTEVARVEELR